MDARRDPGGGKLPLFGADASCDASAELGRGGGPEKLTSELERDLECWEFSVGSTGSEPWSGPGMGLSAVNRGVDTVGLEREKDIEHGGALPWQSGCSFSNRAIMVWRV